MLIFAQGNILWKTLLRKSFVGKQLSSTIDHLCKPYATMVSHDFMVLGLCRRWNWSGWNFVKHQQIGGNYFWFEIMRNSKPFTVQFLSYISSFDPSTTAQCCRFLLKILTKRCYLYKWGQTFFLWKKSWRKMSCYLFTS